MRFCHVLNRVETKNVLRIVLIFTIDNNHIGVVELLYWPGRLIGIVDTVEMEGNQSMFNIQTRKYVIRRSQ